ncbi:MAG: MchE protein [Planctomycetes bacterium]|nr:MchE protein [Planctomycetota bacterium]
MRLWNAVIACAALAVSSAAVAVVVLTYDHWKHLLPTPKEQKETPKESDKADDSVPVSPQAQASLGLEVRPLKPTSYWRKLPLPGQVVELPGHSDRIVTSPVAGIVQRVYHAPWETVRPGERLFTLGLVSEFLQASQSGLFKAQRELETVLKQKASLQEADRQGGAVSPAKFLEVELQEGRLEAAIRGHRFELAARGLTPKEIDRAAAGDFVSSLDLFAPREVGHAKEGTSSHAGHDLYEVEEMKVKVGQQVRAGQPLCTLTFHHQLAVEGHGFKSEVPLLERVARAGTLLEAEWLDEAGNGWPPYPDKLRVRTLANVVETRSQTVPFYIPLTNQFREFDRDGKTYRIWRYRPGQRVRLFIPVEEFRNIFVLPRDAVAHDGLESYVFRQNGDVFERRPVKVVYEDRRFTLVANDGSITQGHNVAINNAAALNRSLKTQAGESGGHHHHH